MELGVEQANWLAKASGMNALPCITLWQPWASWIAAGWKTIESRTHANFNGLVGQRIGIHAGLKWDMNALAVASDHLTPEQLFGTSAFEQVRGMLIGTAIVAEHRALTANDNAAVMADVSSRKMYGLVLVNVRPFSLPIPMPGKQGIWYSPVAISH